MTIDPNNIFGDVSFNNVILWLLSLATIIFILDVIGLLPPWLAKWLAQNRLDATIRALKSLGVKVAWDGDKPAAPGRLSRAIDSLLGEEPEYKARLKAMLAQHTLNAPVDVGQRRTFALQSFVDVIGSTTDPEAARHYARILYTHLHAEKLLDFDFVATPKDGAPLLGYEFAILAGKPLVLGVCSKGNDSTGKSRSHLILDYPLHMSLEARTGLLVDDSTTGGRKMVALAKILRAEGATIQKAAVLFEPIGKGARKLLLENQIELNAIVPGPQGRS
jgi:orotate phosphoribosyltransferase